MEVVVEAAAEIAAEVLLFSPDITSRDSVVVNLLSQPPTQIVQSIT